MISTGGAVQIPHFFFLNEKARLVMLLGYRDAHIPLGSCQEMAVGGKEELVRYEAFDVPLVTDVERESLQGAFAEYRRKKKVSGAS